MAGEAARVAEATVSEMDANRSADMQIDRFRPGLGFAANMRAILMSLAAALVVVSAVIWNPIPLMFALFFGVVGLAERRAGPNIVAAIRAYDHGTPEEGSLSVTITSWDTDDHYHCVVRGDGFPDWRYEFVPQGWRPAERDYPARVWREGPGGRPVLAVVDDGILIPRDDPVPVTVATAGDGGT